MNNGDAVIFPVYCSRLNVAVVVVVFFTYTDAQKQFSLMAMSPSKLSDLAQILYFLCISF